MDGSLDVAETKDGYNESVGVILEALSGADVGPKDG